MVPLSQNYIPILTSSAGLCLTAANWSEVGIRSASFYLDSLLQKPGLALLKKIDNLRHYLGWQGRIILNASTLRANKEGLFQITSPYDGTKIKLTYPELIDLIIHLKPDMVLLPSRVTYDVSNIWDNWPEEIMPFVSIDEPMDSNLNYGVYFKSNQSIEQIEPQDRACYVMGELTLKDIKALNAKGIELVESDTPGSNAMQGIVYCDATELDIKQSEYSQQFEVIDSSCNCPTCSQQLTKAYLHHLLFHTPLLAQRFLMQHNVFYVLNH